MKTKGLNLSSIEAPGMTIRQRAIHYFWGNNAGHPAFRHAMTIHTITKLAEGSGRSPAMLIKQHQIFREAVDAVVAAVSNGESTFFEVFADATRRLKKNQAADPFRWEAARYFLECEGRGTIPTRQSVIESVEKMVKGDASIASKIDRMKLFPKVKD